MPLQHVSWAELQQRCMHVAACVAAKYKPGKGLICRMMLCLRGLRRCCCCHSMCAWLDSCKWNMPLQHVSWAELQQRCKHAAACVAKYQPGAFGLSSGVLSAKFATLLGLSPLLVQRIYLIVVL
jgi:flavin-binding protein dodecin